MIWLIGLYRKFISPLKPPCCRFTPTCSAYAIEAYTKRGFFVGTILTVWRLLRCNPFSKGGYDPVPETGFRTMPMRWSKYRDTEPPRIPLERDEARSADDPQDDLDAEAGLESNQDRSDEP